MLIGAYQHNIDSKGRVAIPAKFREDFGERFFVCKGLDRCLFVLSATEWTRMQDKMKALPIASSAKLQRFYFAGAADVEPDKQGRILLPQHLRDYAGLDKDVTITGLSDRAEIWDTDSWNRYNEEQSDDDMMEAMRLLDF